MTSKKDGFSVAGGMWTASLADITSTGKSFQICGGHRQCYFSYNFSVI